ncbi:LytR/AlgR family response regulator transcription factor [Aestuariibacter salexigens]|uniref:LytR/AlgR family response regulator transcription factor n=1 Tax=Aestuariibacter salexigens TaxID=226010 RepID=UPI000419BC14|nr:LytTR family DNA-binding domain-containing protein [Aestuariibacter salexigens]
MTTIQTIIVDDEPLALGLLKSKLEKNPHIEIVAQCKNGREAIETALSTQADLMFLDIEMPGIDGLEVVKELQSDELPLVVFTTAYEQYAITAFDLHAVDYILKPIDQERIDRAVERAQVRLTQGERGQDKPGIIGAIDSMSHQQDGGDDTSNGARKIVIRDREEITLLKQEDIAWLEAAGDYVCVHANGETHIKRSTLKELLSDLDPSLFKRVHRSTIVNLNYIEKVIPHTKGEFFLILGEHHKVKVSRNYREVIKHYLDEGA